MLQHHEWLGLTGTAGQLPRPEQQTKGKQVALSDIPPISYVLTEDSKQLAIQFDGKPSLYTADQVETLIYLLTSQRAKMLPSVPHQASEVQPDHVLIADAYELQVLPEHSALQVWMQHAGFGWGLVTIPAIGAEHIWQELLDLGKTNVDPPSGHLQ